MRKGAAPPEGGPPRRELPRLDRTRADCETDSPRRVDSTRLGAPSRSELSRSGLLSDPPFSVFTLLRVTLSRHLTSLKGPGLLRQAPEHPVRYAYPAATRRGARQE